MITAAELRNALDYEPATGDFRWRVKPLRAKCNVGDIAGTVPWHGYRMIMIGKKLYRAHRLAWLYMHGEWPTDQIDHINRNRSDNRISNLRIASPRQNQFNRSVCKRNMTGFKGVVVDTRTGRFRARINIDGKSTHIGVFDSAEEAGEAYVAASRRVHREFSFVEQAAATAMLDWS